MSSIFICCGCFYIFLCIALITIIILQKRRNAGLGNLSGGMTQTYWDKNKGNSLDGKLEKFTKILAGLYFIFTFALCFVK